MPKKAKIFGVKSLNSENPDESMRLIEFDTIKVINMLIT